MLPTLLATTSRKLQINIISYLDLVLLSVNNAKSIEDPAYTYNPLQSSIFDEIYKLVALLSSKQLANLL